MTAAERIRFEQMPQRSRIAPTPSGSLLLGNAVNVIIAWVLVRQAGGVLRLRRDDTDGTRCRRPYLEDIVYRLEWLC